MGQMNRPPPPLLPALLAIARAPFLLLALSSVLLAVALAASRATDGFWQDALLVLVGALAAQVSVNALNEHHDFRSGLDLATARTPFSGGSGTLPARPELAGAALALGLGGLGLTLLVGLYFLFSQPQARLPLLGIGALGCLIILAYTPWLTRRPWLCLFAPGLAFGPLMVVGGELALSGETSTTSLLLSLTPFALANNLLLLNQYPDIDADRAHGRLTAPMRLSTAAALRLLEANWALALLLPPALALLGLAPPGVCLVLLLAPLALWIARRCRRSQLALPALLPALGANVGLALLGPLLLAAGLCFA